MSVSVPSAPPGAARVIDVRTPFGRPVAWADVAMVSDIGDSHALNDDRCLVLSSRDLSPDRTGAPDEFLLCLLADGATGSTFAPEADGVESAQAGWRASQLAQAAFVERFLSSGEIDVLDKLKHALRAADRALLESAEGSLSTTLTALYLTADGTAYAASIGDSVLLVMPPSRRTPAERRLKKLGYEDTTAVGSGDTTLSYVDESELIEQWWPNKEGEPVDMHVKSGTYFALLSDGISDNLPVDVIDTLLHRHTLDRATVGLARQTRERRAEMQMQGGGSTNELGLDNMSAIVVRYRGPRPAGGPTTRLDNARLFSVLGTRGGPEPTSGGNFGLVCLADRRESTALVPGFVRDWLESEQQPMPERLTDAYARSVGGAEQPRFAALARDEHGGLHAFSAGLPDLTALLDVSIGERSVDAPRDNPVQRFLYSPRLWASSIAAMAVFLLVSTAFATGTVRPAPPPAPSPAPGEPAPTPDLRPRISIGDIFLVGPPPDATPTAVPAPEVVEAHADEAAPTEDAEEPEEAPPAPSQRTQPARPRAPAAPRQAVCNNVFGIGCPPQPPRPSDRVVPVPSPAASVPSDRPSSGSDLDAALQAASIADQRFERGLALSSAPGPTPSPTRP